MGPALHLKELPTLTTRVPFRTVSTAPRPFRFKPLPAVFLLVSAAEPSARGGCDLRTQARCLWTRPWGRPLHLSHIPLCASVDFTDARKLSRPTSSVLDMCTRPETTCALRTRPPWCLTAQVTIATGEAIMTTPTPSEVVRLFKSLNHWGLASFVRADR